MLVPRSFKYSSSPPNVAESMHDRSYRRSPARKQLNPHVNATSPRVSPARVESEPVTIPTSKPSNAVVSDRSPTDRSHEMPNYQSQTLPTGRRKRSTHDPDALPPAVAALLAVTAIPPRKPNRYRKTPGRDRRISIEELIKDWKSDSSLKPASYGSPGLSILLEDTDYEDEDGVRTDCSPDPAFLKARSPSSESMPSLEADDRSVLSVGSPSTPGSLRSRKSYQNIKSKSRSLPTVEDCAFDHPLVPQAQPEDEDDFRLPTQKQNVSSNKPRTSFKSNLTASLQSLKKAAVESISSISRASSAPSFSRHTAPPMDDMLWSHPFLFPRFSSEVRPALDHMPSEAERRYLNPIPLTFEEQEAPFQQALHAPYLAEAIEDAPTIQMQTYNSRGRRKAGARRAAPNPSSEAGRALLGAEGVRTREVRENSDFLRIVVMEMNMRREGKLEQGRAKIWLPPRESTPVPQSIDRVPRRWVGESAY